MMVGVLVCIEVTEIIESVLNSGVPQGRIYPEVGQKIYTTTKDRVKMNHLLCTPCIVWG